MRRRFLLALGALAIWTGRPAPVDAHRLDEYLQATRVAVDIDRVSLEIDLTPGASVGPKVFGWMDTDGDGRLSSRESRAYAQEMLGSIVLSADGRRASLTLVDSQFPDLHEVMAGVGTIRLRAVARIPAAGSGRHALTYVNAHRPEGSLYLANALRPSDGRITISSQMRDPAQTTLTLNYDVAAGGGARIATLVTGFGLVGLLGLARRSRRERRGDPVAPSPVR